MKPNVMIESRSTCARDKNNDETFTTWGKKKKKEWEKENKSGISRLVHGAPVLCNKCWQTTHKDNLAH